MTSSGPCPLMAPLASRCRLGPSRSRAAGDRVDPRCAQPGGAVTLEGGDPARQLASGQAAETTGFLDGDLSLAQGGEDRRLTARHPAFARKRQSRRASFILERCVRRIEHIGPPLSFRSVAGPRAKANLSLLGVVN